MESAVRPMAIVLCIWAVLSYTRPEVIPGMVALVVGAVLVLLLIARTLSLPWSSPLVHGFISLVLLSAIWADSATASLSSSALLLVITGSAAFIARYLTAEDVLKVLDWGFRVVIVASLAVAVIIPSFGITSRAWTYGALEGIYPHRNVLGYVAVLGLITLLYAPVRRRWSKLLWASVYVGTVIWTGSATSIVGIVLALTLAFVLRVTSTKDVRTRIVATVLVLTSGSVALVVATYNPSTLFDALGRDETLTGRTEIWRGVTFALSLRPILGYGWNSILGESTTSGRLILPYAGWYTNSTHNGYLAVALQLGVVGLVVAALILIRALYGSFRLVLRRGGAFWAWCVQIVVALATVNVAETRAFLDFGWFLIVLISTKIMLENRLIRVGAGRMSVENR